jgi:hypothetical protein
MKYRVFMTTQDPYHTPIEVEASQVEVESDHTLRFYRKKKGQDGNEDSRELVRCFHPDHWTNFGIAIEGERPKED